MEDGLHQRRRVRQALHKEAAAWRGRCRLYEGDAESPGDREARLWIESLLEDKDPVVRPEQALIVTRFWKPSMTLPALASQYTLRMGGSWTN